MPCDKIRTQKVTKIMIYFDVFKFYRETNREK